MKMSNISNVELTRLWNMVFNLSVQMLHNEIDAEEATQSIFEKVLKKLPTFKNQSKLSTWIYRISYNYLIDEIRKKNPQEISFDLFENDVTNFQPYENELGLSAYEEKVYIEEIKVGCTLALLQCLDPQNRFIYIIGTIFDFPRKEAAEICDMEYDKYRKRLSRTKEKIKYFMGKNCGLINPGAECKCKKRVFIARERGRINHERILYQTENKLIRNCIKEMNEIDEIAMIYKNNPFIETSKDISHMLNQFNVLQEIN
jgi:RNA polymerase sigma factor (sigma-70 family)